MKYDESKQYGFTDENVNGSEEWMGFRWCLSTR